MKPLKPIVIACLVNLVAACASVRSFKMPDVEESLTRAFQKAEEMNASMKSDFTQKRDLIESLRKGKSTGFKQNEAQVSAKFSAMESHLSAAGEQSKVMSDARGNLASLAYAKKEIRADEPEYSRVEDLVREFQTAVERFNTSAAEYSRESNSLADFVVLKKLYFNFDVSDFIKKIEQARETAQENQSLMDAEIRRAEDIRDSFQDAEQRAPVEQALRQMNSARIDHAERLRNLSALGTELSAQAKGQTRIPSTSSNWNEIQRIVADVDRVTLTLTQSFRVFQLKAQRARDLTKGN